jgi:hypothetical protein
LAASQHGSPQGNIFDLLARLVLQPPTSILVLGPANATPVRFSVKLNGAAPTTIMDPIPALMARATLDGYECISSYGRRGRSRM